MLAKTYIDSVAEEVISARMQTQREVGDNRVEKGAKRQEGYIGNTGSQYEGGWRDQAIVAFSEKDRPVFEVGWYTRNRHEGQEGDAI